MSTNVAAARRRVARALALAFALALPIAATASAQPIHEHALRITTAAEIGNGRLVLIPKGGDRRPDAAESLLVGARVGLDVGFNRRVALETAIAVHWYAMQSFALVEAHSAPRIRFIRAEHDEWYIRPLVGAALVGVNRSNVAFVAGLGVGYRRQLSTSVDVFFELGYRLRLMRHLETGYSQRVFDGFTPTATPNGLACFLGLTAGAGFGL